MSITTLMPVYPRCDVRPVRGDHCHLIDEDGTRYLDFASGIAVNLLGHSHEGLIGAIQQQAETLMHVSNMYGSPQGEALASRLVELTFADTVFFTNSGAEAVETAIKTARAYHQAGGDAQRTELITFTSAFHGRTMATISASNQTKMHDGFQPLLGGFRYCEFDDLQQAQSLIGPSTAGFLVEPIQGEGGIRPASQEFMTGLRALANKHDLMLVLDEVQCGVARTGKFYAHEHYGIEPDILASAKGIGGGFPLGACLATEKAARGMTFGTHGSTYGGNPLAMAAGGAVLDAVANDAFPGRGHGQGRPYPIAAGTVHWQPSRPVRADPRAGIDAGAEDESRKPTLLRPSARQLPADDGRGGRQYAAHPAAAGSGRCGDRGVLRQIVRRRGKLPDSRRRLMART